MDIVLIVRSTQNNRGLDQYLNKRKGCLLTKYLDKYLNLKEKTYKTTDMGKGGRYRTIKKLLEMSGWELLILAVFISFLFIEPFKTLGAIALVVIILPKIVEK